MNSKYTELLKSKMSETSLQKLTVLKNEKVMDFIGSFAEHCNPASIYVCDDSLEDEQYIRDMALEKGEEFKLSKEEQNPGQHPDSQQHDRFAPVQGPGNDRFIATIKPVHQPIGERPFGDHRL
nr:hypothetical protein [Spirochaetales bacterium]